MNEIVSDELDLLYTRSKRKELIESITKEGPPTDIKNQSILLQALDGMDKVSLSKMKMKSDEGISNTQAQAASIIAELFNDARTKTIGLSTDMVGTIQVLDSDVAPTRLIEGELGFVNTHDTFESFSNRVANGQL